MSAEVPFTKLILARHGVTAENRTKTLQGQTQNQLSLEGVIQAAELSHKNLKTAGSTLFIAPT